MVPASKIDHAWYVNWSIELLNSQSKVRLFLKILSQNSDAGILYIERFFEE
jgi:hypothetical protein